MTANHTPGPWLTHREGFSTVYVEARIGGGWVQKIAACGPTSEGSEQQDANARLIAAAPELLEALQKMLPELRGLSIVSDTAAEMLREAEAAIAKATGEQT